MIPCEAERGRSADGKKRSFWPVGCNAVLGAQLSNVSPAGKPFDELDSRIRYPVGKSHGEALRVTTVALDVEVQVPFGSDTVSRVNLNSRR